jgi:hypothetical protein
MKVLVSKVYRNQKLNFGKFFVEFKGEKAQVSDEQAEEILASGFPNIFLEGSEQAAPKPKKQASEEASEREVELVQEVNRLTDKVAALELEKEKLKVDNEAWKKAYEEATNATGEAVPNEKEGTHSQIYEDEKKEEIEVDEKADPKEELRAAMNGLTVKQLKELAKGKDYNLTDEDIAPYPKKADLIEFLLTR